MCLENQTRITEVTLLGFSNLFQLKDFLFVSFIILYLSIVMGNTLIMSLIITSPKLHSPMYFFLCNLSMCEILFPTFTMPNVLYVVWGNGGTIPLYFCIGQYYLSASMGATEILILSIMAYDRYLAICNPLRYSSLMNSETQNNLACGAWLSGFIGLSITALSLCNLQFCQADTIDYIFCDIDPILGLSSTENSLVKVEALVITTVFGLVPFIFILLSYVSILRTTMTISSRKGRQKTFSTCSSHLASVCMYFGSVFVIYLCPSETYTLKKVLSLVYTVLTPLFNPLIYSLRNKEMKDCLKSLVVYLKDKETN